MGNLLRWLFLIVAGSTGPFGIVLLIAFLLYYLITADAFGAPPLAPFAPLVKRDLKDSVLKTDAYALSLRPEMFRMKNRRRLKDGFGRNAAQEGGANGKPGDGIITDAQKAKEQAEKEER